MFDWMNGMNHVLCLIGEVKKDRNKQRFFLC
jgi:hypothetical protein